LPGFDGGNATFHRANAVQVFIQFPPVSCRQCPPELPRAAQNKVQHASIQRTHLIRTAGMALLFLLVE
jgi:hypothetical protein